MTRRRPTTRKGKGSDELGIELDPRIRAYCVKCKCTRAVPEQGRRMPIGLGDVLVVNADRCPRCGATRVQIVFDLQ